MIKIDIDTRCWKIPKEECFLGVESDDKVRILQFELSKNEFCDGLNFTDCNCFINYKNEGNDTIPYVITDMELQEDGTVTFTWEVSRGATIFKGNTFAILCAKKVSDDGTITNEWNSRIGSFTVAKGIEPLSSINEVPEIDIISQLLLVAQETNTNAQNNIEQSNTLLEKAEGLAYLKDDFDVLEARMNQFTSLQEGSTTGDAELIDGRIGYDGKVYDNIGGAIREQISELKGDIGNQEDKLEPIVKSKQDLKDAFYIVDVYGNIICKVDKDGVHSTGFDGKNLALNDVISTYEDSFYISDSNGNVIFMANKDGVRGLNMGTSSGIDSPFKGMKLLTIGDSLSAHNNWQKWLVEWLGVTFDNDENINGKDGHKPMAKGGTAIAPTSEDSIYMRALDAKYYADNTNGTIIIIYAGQNDSVALGTIDDTPYTDRTVTSPSNLTFYSSYMGMVENILADIPSARIYLMTQMPVRLEIGMTGTVDPYIGVIRFPDMTSVLAYEASRYKKVEAIRAISKKYSLPCIDLWADSGINDYNSRYWYGAVGGTCGQVHPNNIGYKRMAEVAVAKMY